MSQLKRIIVGVDLRGGGEAALDSGIVLASKCNAGLRLVHAVEPPHLYRQIPHPVAAQHSREQIIEQAGRKLEEIAAKPAKK